MMFKFVRFNIYLFLAAWVSLGMTGCASEAHKKKKEISTMEFHLETNRDGSPDNMKASIYRAHPIVIDVEKEPFVDSIDVVEARVVDELGGFAIEVKFNWRGTQLLEGITASNRGRRIAILCGFGESRWLAAPMIRKQISNGTFTFTPDCTRAEADRIVNGLRNVAEKIKKDDVF